MYDVAADYDRNVNIIVGESDIKSDVGSSTQHLQIVITVHLA